MLSGNDVMMNLLFCPPVTLPSRVSNLSLSYPGGVTQPTSPAAITLNSSSQEP